MQSMATYRAEVDGVWDATVFVEAGRQLGYPRIRLDDGGSVPPGKAAWLKFCAFATEEKVKRAAVAVTALLDAQGRTHDGCRSPRRGLPCSPPSAIAQCAACERCRHRLTCPRRFSPPGDHQPLARQTA